MRVNPSDFEVVNREQAFFAGRQTGSREIEVAGSGVSRTFGLPMLREKPALVIGIDNDELLDIYGLGKRYISNDAKALLEATDPEAFEFAECSAVDGIGRPQKPYWMMDVVRVVDEIDAQRSSIITYSERNPGADDAATNPFVTVLNDVHFPTLGSADHAFHYIKYIPHFIFDSVIVDAWRNAGLTGALFTPLQPPTKAERLLSDHFANYPYWNDRG